MRIVDSGQGLLYAGNILSKIEDIAVGKAAGKAKKYVGKISSKLVRNIKGEPQYGEGLYTQAAHSFSGRDRTFSHSRERSDDIGSGQETTEATSEEFGEEPLEKVKLSLNQVLAMTVV